MTWMKVDDNLHAHRKPKKAGVPAMGLWVLAGSWCADMLTDGFIPDYIAASLDPAYEEHAAALVRAGLWDAAEQDGDEGWQFDGWDEYQPARAEVLSKREQERDKKRKQRRNSSGQFEDSHQSPEDVPEVVPQGQGRDSDGSHAVPSRPDPSRPKEANASPKGAADKDAEGQRPDVDAVCNHLADRIEANGARRPTVTKVWRREARLLIDKDGYTEQQIHWIIDWCQTDQFWRTNILSTDKLREKFEQLKLKALSESRPPVSKRQQEIDAFLAAPTPTRLEVMQ